MTSGLGQAEIVIVHVGLGSGGGCWTELLCARDDRGRGLVELDLRAACIAAYVAPALAILARTSLPRSLARLLELRYHLSSSPLSLEK